MAFAPRVRALGVLAILAVTVGPVPAVDASGQLVCRFKEHIVEHNDGWYEILGPEYDARQGEAVIEKVAISPNSTSRLYVTNGVSVKRSTDSGCSWNEPIFPMADAVVDAKPTEADPYLQNNTVADIGLMGRIPANQGHDELWIASYDHSNGVYHPHVWRSTNADERDATITEKSDGLPALGRPLMLGLGRVSGSGYLLVDVMLPEPQVPTGNITPAGPALYHKSPASPQSGTESGWNRKRLPDGFTNLDGMAVDPDASSIIWAWQGSKLARSIDEGYFWTVSDLKAKITSVTLQRNPEGSTESFAYVAASPSAGAPARIAMTTDAKAFEPLPTLPPAAAGEASSMAIGIEKDMLAVSTARGIFGYDLRLDKWVPFSPKGVTAPLEGLAFTAGRPPVLFTHTDQRIFRKQLYKPNLFVERPGIKLGGGKIPYLPPLTELPHSTLKGPVMTPPRAEVTVKPGKTTSLPLEFAVPPSPLPLDVYFLVDMTDSMRPSIKGLRDGMNEIVEALSLKGIDAWFGVGEFRDLGHTAPAQCPVVQGSKSQSCVYRRLVKLAPPGEELRSTLSGLPDKVQGGGDEPEAQTIGLTQSVSKKGLPGLVDENTDAGFRPGAVSVILLITDAYFHQGGEERYPTIDQALTTLNAADVKVAGVAAHTSNDLDAARGDLEEIAAGTQTVAPTSGVDCDGDKMISADKDVLPGDPLVCTTEQAGDEAINITPAIISLLLGIPDPGPFGTQFYGDQSVIKKVTGTSKGIFNLKAENRMKFGIDFTCTPEQDGQDFPIVVDGTVWDSPVARSFITVQCRDVPKVDPPPLIFIPPIPLPPPLVPPLPPPAQPGPFPQPPQNPPPNINPNSGFASQEEQQLQLAAVGQDGSEQQEQEETADEYAMSALERPEDTSPVPLYAGAALLTSLATGAAMRRRLRVQRSTVRF